MEISLLGVFLAAVASMVIGMTWYNPKVLGTAWMQMSGLSPQVMGASKTLMIVNPLIAFVANIIMAYVLAHFAIAWGVYDWASALELAFWVWLGFQVPIALGVVLWEMKSWKLFFLNSAHQFVSVIVMSLVLLYFMF